MQYQYFQHSNGKIAYCQFGEGEELLIAIHGFSDRASLFDVLKKGLRNKHTVYAFDLPYHGQTEWKKDHFDKEDVLDMIQLILEKEKQQQFALMGYSMGGRIIQVLLPEIVERVTHLYLIAPDGIQTKWMFNVNQFPIFIRRLLQRVLRKPERFFRLLHWFYQKQFITKFIHDFAYNHLKTPERRHRLFCTWNSIHYFKTNPSKFKKLLQSYQLPTYLYYGKRDEVIQVSSGQWLSEGLPRVSLHTLDEGHLLIDQSLNQLLDQQLNSQAVSSKI